MKTKAINSELKENLLKDNSSDKTTDTFYNKKYE